MSTITKKDLHIFRGTYNECMAQETEDMTIYLAWDTQEIFVGNKSGVKVPYGVTRTIYKRIEEYIEIIKSDILKKNEEILNEFTESIINNKIEEYFEKVANTRIEEIVSEKTNSIKKDIPTKISQLINDSNFVENSELDNYYTKNETDIKIANAISGGEINLSNYYTKPEVDNEIEKINTKISEIDISGQLTDYAKTSEVTSKIEAVRANIDEKVSDMATKTELNTYAKKEEVDNTQFLYLSGSEMQNIKDVKPFQMVICTENTTNGTPIYKANQIYSYNETEKRFKPLAGSGAITKDTITSIITLNVDNWPKQSGAEEISDKTIIVGSLDAKITNRNILKSVDLQVNNFSDFVYWEELKNEKENNSKIKFDPNELTIDASAPVTYSIVVNGKLIKAEDDDYKYAVKNALVSCSYYQPWLFGEADNLIHYKPDTTEMQTTVLHKPTNIYLYTTKKVTKFTSGGFNAPFELTSDEMVSISVNNIKDVRYYEYKLEDVNDDINSIFEANIIL